MGGRDVGTQNPTSKTLITGRSLTAEDPDQRLTQWRGRGALSNDSGRFETAQRRALDDGWAPVAPEDGAEPGETARPTEIMRESIRTIISRNDSPDISFDQSINPYRGCEHGCIYCFARPTHAFLGLSPGVDFETKLTIKPGAAAVLRRELSARSYVPKLIALGTNTDPYQPIEKTYRTTREILEVLRAFHHPVGIVTKSALILRDLDLLAPMARAGLAKVAISVTTLDRGLARRMEARASAPHRRIETIRALAAAGVPVTVMASPMIPGLNDMELEAILTAAREAGAERAGYIVLRLPHEIKDLFREWLAVHAPDRAKRVMALVRSMRNGADYDAEWGTRMKGEGALAQLLADRFRLVCARLGFATGRSPLDVSQFRRPFSAGADPRQGTLWED